MTADNRPRPITPSSPDAADLVRRYRASGVHVSHREGERSLKQRLLALVGKDERTRRKRLAGSGTIRHSSEARVPMTREELRARSKTRNRRRNRKIHSRKRTALLIAVSRYLLLWTVVIAITFFVLSR